MADGEICEGKRVKRKRRNMMASVIANSQNINQENATTVKRSSKYRGVSRHRWTGRYEAHLWDKLSWNVTQKKKGKQVYLVQLSPSIENSFTKDKQMFTSQYLETEFSWRGKSRTVSKILKSFGCKISNVRQQIAQTLNAGGAYDDEEAAARAYDMAALKYWGVTTLTNFPINDYNKEIEFMQTVTKEEYLASLRRKSSGFSRGVSKYRGVARHHHNGRWEARIGRVFGNKYLYLGTYSTQEEAAKAYDIAAIEYRGINAVTNFDLSTYITWLKPGANTSIPSRDIKLSTQSPVTSSSFTCGQNLKLSYLPTKAFKTIDVSKQETNGRKIPYNSRKESSSPKALDLLFRSSVFRELVRRNSNLLEEEREDESIENSHAIEFQGQHNFSYAQNMIRSNTVGMIPIF